MSLESSDGTVGERQMSGGTADQRLSRSGGGTRGEERRWTACVSATDLQLQGRQGLLEHQLCGSGYSVAVVAAIEEPHVLPLLRLLANLLLTRASDDARGNKSHLSCSHVALASLNGALKEMEVGSAKLLTRTPRTVHPFRDVC